MNYIPRNPAFAAMIQSKLEKQHFMNFIGFRITGIEAGIIDGELQVSEQHRQQNGFLHGGVIATLADLVAGFAAFSLVEQHQTVVTAELKISYLNPGIGDKVYAKGWVLKPGNMLHFCEAEIWYEKEGEKMQVAKASATMAVVVIS
jgi:uncharacterized protein (TIGR00369 family)